VVVALHWERSELGGTEPEALARQRRLAEAAGAAVVSLEPAFAAALERGEQPYRDHIHPTALGQRLIAEALLEPLAAALGGS
jgi:lysophospholipase L1-like esterase